MMPAMTSSPAEAPEREFSRIGVIGLGTMGAGIAEVFARNGYDVTGVEINDEALDRGREHLEHSTDRAVARGKLTEAEQAELLGRITFTTSMKDLADADFVVEAVVESIEIKKSVFRELDDIVRPEAILATNTSSLSVTEISTANHHPGRVVGVHFFNPAPVQRLVEVIRTVVTEPEVLADVERLLTSWARARSSAATRPASSPTRCCSATSTTRSRCTRPTTPRARTSTRPCATAAATRWARWRCST